MNGSYVEGSETAIIMDLDAIDDVRDELNKRRNECNSRYKALTTECNKDYFGTLKNCSQFNTSSFDTYDNLVKNIDNCLNTILSSINNYVSEQRNTDVENEKELDSMEEPAVEDDSSNKTEEVQPTTNNATETSLDSESLETNEQDKAELKTEEEKEEKTGLEKLKITKTGKELTSELKSSEIQSQEQLKDMSNNSVEEQKVVDDNYNVNNQSLSDINNAPTEEVNAVVESSIETPELLTMIDFNKVSDNDYSTFVNDLIKCANENGVTVDVLLKNTNYSQKVKDMCSLCNISADFKNSIIDGKTAIDVQRDIYDSIFVDTVGGKSESYSRLLDNCSEGFKNSL